MTDVGKQSKAPRHVIAAIGLVDLFGISVQTARRHAKLRLFKVWGISHTGGSVVQSFRPVRWIHTSTD